MPGSDSRCVLSPLLCSTASAWCSWPVGGGTERLETKSSFPDHFMCWQMTGTTQQNTKSPQVHIPAASAAGNTSVSVTLDPQAQLESDKRAVYRSVLCRVCALISTQITTVPPRFCLTTLEEVFVFNNYHVSISGDFPPVRSVYSGKQSFKSINLPNWMFWGATGTNPTHFK